MNDINKRELIIFSFISFAIFLSIIIIAPMAGEDYGLTKTFHHEGILERLNYAISRSQVQMASWNARFGEQIAIFELSLPRWISVIIYSLSFVCFSYCIGVLTCMDKAGIWKNTSMYVAGLTFLLWPGMEVFFWKTANSEYLQTMMLTIIVILPYSDKRLLEELQKRKIKFTFYLTLCFISGLSFENVPFAVSISLLALCVWDKRHKIINFLPISLILSGWLILITADSTSLRREYYGKTIKSNSSLLNYYLDRFLDVTLTFIDTSGLIFSLSLVSLTYLFKLKLITKYHVILILASILVVGSMLASPYTEARSFLFAWCVMYSFICYAFVTFINRNDFKNLSAIILFSSMCFGLYTLKTYSIYGEKIKIREQAILNAVGTQKCATGLSIKAITVNSGYRYVNNRDPWVINNTSEVSKYYNCVIKTY
jgi:hypothetical protein